MDLTTYVSQYVYVVISDNICFPIETALDILDIVYEWLSA